MKPADLKRELGKRLDLPQRLINDLFKLMTEIMQEAHERGETVVTPWRKYG